MCNESLLAIYELFLQRTALRIHFIELHLAGLPEPDLISEDDRRNQPATYATLFSDECRPYMEKLYYEAIEQLNGLTFDRSEDLLNGLAFIQEVIATALWKYHCNVGVVLESFAREFDRLDHPSERRRLHDEAQRVL